MNKFVTTSKRKIGADEVQAVDARELHEFLESKSPFSTWIANRIRQGDFTEDTDFSTINNYLYNPPLKEYNLSIDMAKNISILEKTAKGRQVRQYFIGCERRLKTSAISTELELVGKGAKKFVRTLRKQFKQEGQLKEIER